MHIQSTQYINSNSNPGGEFSLDEIHNHEENELKDCDIQEYDSLETRSRAYTSTCKNICDCETPLDTVNSWDSHSHYRQLIRFSSNSLYSGITIYCNHAHLITSIGIIRLLLIISTAACITCLCSSGIVKAGLVVLPLVNRIKFMIFVHLLGFFVTGILLFLEITHLIHLFPFNWIKLNTYFFVCLSILFLTSSTLIFYTMFTFEAFYRISSWTKHHLLAASVNNRVYLHSGISVSHHFPLLFAKSIWACPRSM
ncbi:uncharacterized protein LOC108737031 isoform X2 [Agrilus planipennis]|uniref:Uncharacterized protein LOC108737031 isoform X2 n=1 Tax=Agrilus planipennis TaxID=224129 RepID=A0A1W4WXD2_AGRPL|nr:uncharacterized protein LOC108737031 isoform X2 [Agrilus planipennis]